MAKTDRQGLFDGVRRSPIAGLAAGTMAGQAAAEAGCWPPVPLGVALGLLAAAGVLWRPARWPATIIVAAGLAGFCQARWATRPPDDPAQVVAQAPGRTTLVARVVDAPLLPSPRLRVVLEVEQVQRAGVWQAARGRVLLSIAHGRRRWRTGDRFAGTLRLKRPRNFGNPGEFDYAGYLARRGILVTAFLYDDSEGTLAPGEAGVGWLDAWRARAAAAIVENADTPAREILGALILGAQDAVPEEVREQFAVAGVSHVLSISGLHIAMVGGAAFAGIRWLLARSRWLLLRASVPKWAAALSMVPVIVYGALANGGVATWRSVLMMGVYVGAVLGDRQHDLLVGVAAAAWLISLIWPGSVLDISFQLSFVSVATLIVGMDRAGRWWGDYEARRLLWLRPDLRRWLAAGLAYLAVTVVATIGTAPLTAFHFNRVSLVAVLANPVVVPLLGSVAVGLGLLGALATLAWEPLAVPLLMGASVAIQVGTRATALLAALPAAAVRVVTPSVTEIALAYLTMLGVVCGSRRSRCGVGAAGLLLLAAALGWDARERWRGDTLRITFLSVGQGDSTVVRFPGGAVMVVDAGGLPGFDTGERVVAPFLWRSKIGRIDVLALTHAQFDHYGGAAFLAREFRPREFWSNGAAAPAASYAEMREAVAASGARAVVARRGDMKQFGGCQVRVLSPPPDQIGARPNDASIVLRIACGAVSVMLPGDLEAAGEAGLVAADSGLRSSVLKLGHHGSATSSSPPFLEAVAADLAVVSAGHGNRFGFPHPSVLEACAHRGVRVLRTDHDGAITLETGGVEGFRLRTGAAQRVVADQ